MLTLRVYVSHCEAHNSNNENTVKGQSISFHVRIGNTFSTSFNMKIISLILLRALTSEQEATTLVSAYKLDDFNFFQREG